GHRYPPQPRTRPGKQAPTPTTRPRSGSTPRGPAHADEISSQFDNNRPLLKILASHPQAASKTPSTPQNPSSQRREPAALKITIESINARYRRAIRARGLFPTDQAAMKCLYLVTRSLDPTGRGRARWAMRWKPALNAFAITFNGRITPTGN